MTTRKKRDVNKGMVKVLAWGRRWIIFACFRTLTEISEPGVRILYPIGPKEKQQRWVLRQVDALALKLGSWPL